LLYALNYSSRIKLLIYKDKVNPDLMELVEAMTDFGWTSPYCFTDLGLVLAHTWC